MPTFTYYAFGKPVRLSVTPQAKAFAAAAAKPRMAAAHSALHAGAKRFADLYAEVNESQTLVVATANPMVTMLATEAVIVEGAAKATLKKLRAQYGMEIVREGLMGKILLRNPNEGGADAVKRAFECAAAVFKAGHAVAAHPNLVRVVQHTVRKPARAARAAADAPWWNHANDGTPGVRGADAAVRAAWTVHRGDPAVRVAVLDEGVDPDHPDLRSAIVAQKDFVDGNPTAAPDGNDAHGTACAGIVAGRGDKFPGVAQCSLVGVRIAKDDGGGGWVFDDFATADAIDWSWKEAKADVLSNSWGGGTPSDAITNAFVRARTKGRGGKGSVVAIASGNSNGRIDFPGNLPQVLCVGASNEWDERKSPTSRDGENWWGSCFGPELSLVAPGVHIAATDISGARGYDRGDHTLTFNGTSSATPHVAGAAALVLAVAPQLTEKQVRDVLAGEAVKMSGKGKLDPARKWNREMGWGRLDIHAAMHGPARVTVMDKAPDYYYAGGQRVPLAAANDLIAVDLAKLAASELQDLDLAALRAGRVLRGTVRLVERGTLSAAGLENLSKGGSGYPVFRQDGAIMVAMPEVRVEDPRANVLAKARRWAADRRSTVETEDDYLTIRPEQPSGAAALALANELFEQCQVASATPRFLRVVPRPDTSTPRRGP